MSLARGKYGIEYNPNPVNDGSSGLGWIVVTVVIVALVSLVWTLVGRFRSSAEPPVEEICIDPPDPPVVEAVQVEPSPATSAEPDPEPAPPPPVAPTYAMPARGEKPPCARSRPVSPANRKALMKIDPPDEPPA